MKHIPVILVLIFSWTSLLGIDPGDISRYDNQLDERDWEELRNFLNTKRTIDVAEKSGNLTLSGDVRTEWRHMTERIEDIRLRSRHVKKGNCDDCGGQPSCACGRGCEFGGGCFSYRNGKTAEVQFPPNKKIVPIFLPLCKPVTHNDFDVELNLNIDYVCEGAWAVGQLTFDNTSGVNDPGIGCACDPAGFHGSGFGCDINLKKAYMGYNVFCCGDSRFDVELGRRNLYHAFDSRVQFCSRFDGILLKYSSVWGSLADWYVKGAGFVVDEKVDHFSWVVEGALQNICDSGLDLKYSLIDWHKHGRNRCGIRNPRGMKFLNSQVSWIYRFYADYMGVPSKFFGGIVYNHYKDHLYPVPKQQQATSEESEEILPLHLCKCGCDRNVDFRHSKDENIAWYVGFRFGEVIRKGDWALEIQYQLVEPFSVPDEDCCGIGRGNWLNESTTYAGRGNTNYRGFHIEALYALTDNLNLDSIIEYSQEVVKTIGGKHSYSKFELEAIYAF